MEESKSPIGFLSEEKGMNLLPPDQFSVKDSFAPARSTFLTEDEIACMTISGSHVSERGFCIYSHFMQCYDADACVAFQKNEYGIGGYSYTGYDEWYDSKGIRLSRSDDFSDSDYDTVTLNWKQVPKRTAGLNREDRYLSAKEKQLLPEYKKCSSLHKCRYFW